MIPLLLALLATCAPAAAQTTPEALPIPKRAATMPRPWRPRLIEADRLLRIGSHERAERALDEAEKLGAPRTQVLRYRIELAQALDDAETVAALCREGLAARAAQPRLLRALARALMDLDRRTEAREALDDLFALNSNRGGVVAEAVLMWRESGYPDEGLALCDSLRAARHEDRLYMRQRAACLLDLDRVEEGMAEYVRELGLNPLNLPMIREALWDLLPDGVPVERALAALEELDEGTSPEPALLRVDLRLRQGDDRRALETVRPLLDVPAWSEAVMRFVSGRAREADLQADDRVRHATQRWLTEVLSALLSEGRLPRGRRPRVADLLAGVCEQVLERGDAGTDPARAVERLGAALDLVKLYSPGSTRLYSAQIRLAAHTRDVLKRPAAAARRLEALLVDLNLPLEGVALARLALGECHLAAGDTARARTVLTRLGADTRFHGAAAHAHALLGRLDFAQGSWETARDRLAAVALDDPRADYVNDALDLALLVAEELVNPTGGPDRLRAYAPCVYWELRGDAEARRDALATFLAGTDAGAGEVDHLRDRARLELARLLVGAGEVADAAELCLRLAQDSPDGLRAAAALFLRGEALISAGRVREGREAWERLLIQYPDSLEAEDARMRLRSLS